jgi:hypothetical protein
VIPGTIRSSSSPFHDPPLPPITLIHTLSFIHHSSFIIHHFVISSFHHRHPVSASVHVPLTYLTLPLPLPLLRTVTVTVAPYSVPAFSIVPRTYHVLFHFEPLPYSELVLFPPPSFLPVPIASPSSICSIDLGFCQLFGADIPSSRPSADQRMPARFLPVGCVCLHVFVLCTYKNLLNSDPES